jgi:hypothetical protein
MAKVHAPLLAFNRGEVSKTALARLDVGKLALAAECQLNWEPKVLGPMGMRPGLLYVGEVASDAQTFLMDFVYAQDDTALLEFTSGEMRIWINDVLVSRPAVSTTISDPTFQGGGAWDSTDTTDGCTATIAAGTLQLVAHPIRGLARVKQAVTVALGDQNKEHGIRVVVTKGPVTFRAGSAMGLDDLIATTSLDNGTHCLACTPTGATIAIQIDSTDGWSKFVTGCAIETPGWLQVPSPWGTSDFETIRYSQSGDIIFVGSYGRQQYKIERRGVRPGARGWSIVQYRATNGPFAPAPAIEANMSPSVLFGDGLMSCDQPFFQPGHVGALFRLNMSNQSNLVLLGGNNAFSDPVRVVGVGAAARDYIWTATGTWAGRLVLQRSFDGPDTGFVTVSSITANGSLPSSTGGAAATPNLDNVIVWERIGFLSGEYTSGTAQVVCDYGGGGRSGIARVVSYSSPTLVTIEVLERMPSLVPTTNWQEGQWSGAVGWPSAGTFFEGRLWWSNGDSVWGSQSDNFYGFASEDAAGTAIGDSAVISETFGEGPVDRVNWMLPLTRLLCGREMSIASVRSSSFDEVVTPTNISVKDCSTQGAARIRAIKLDKTGIFIQQTGRRVYQLAFNGNELDYAAHDLTRLNIDIGQPGFTDIAVARQVDTAIYLPRTEGQCAVLLHDADDEVMAWWRVQTMGVIECVRVLPNASGGEDFVYFVIKRVIGGQTRRFIEKFALRDNCAGGLMNQLFDSGVSYSGAPSTTITLAHMPDTEVGIWGDGQYLGLATTNDFGVATLPGGKSCSKIAAGLIGYRVAYSGDVTSTISVPAAYNGLPCEVFADQQPSDRMVRVGTLVPSGGVLTLPNGWQASAVVAFFGFMAPFQSAKLGAGAQLGTALTQRKKVSHLGLVLFDAGATSVQTGGRFDALDDLPLVEDEAVVPSSTIWSEYDQPMIELSGEWDTDSRVCLLGQAPLPCKVGALVVDMSTNG